MVFVSELTNLPGGPVDGKRERLPNGALYSSFDPASSQKFAGKPQFTYLQVVEPQVGSRLLVLDPATKNYAYVNASDVGP